MNANGRRSWPRRHHFLPRFHLDMFAAGTRRDVGVFDKRWGKFGRIPAASAARVLDYYLLPGVSLAERLSLEYDFGKLESLVAPVIGGLDVAPPGPVELDRVDRHNLASYIALLHVRGPAYRDDAHRRALELSVDAEALGLSDPEDFLMAARRLGMKGTAEELGRRRQLAVLGLKSGQLRIGVPRTASLGGIVPALNKGVPLLLEREWELLRAPGWPDFLIGDQPVALLAGGQIAPSIGFGSPGVQVFMPLSPRTLLLISSRPAQALPLMVKTEPVGQLGEPWWALANKVAWATAQRFVWGRRSSLQATELVIPADLRRRDFRVLDAEQEARRKEVARDRREKRRSADRQGRLEHLA